MGDYDRTSAPSGSAATFMSEATVKVHVRRIMQKFGATNRTQAVISAMGNH